MAFRVRMARVADLDRLVALAALSEGGMTNFPNDRPALEEKVVWSERSCAADIAAPDDEFYLFVLEDRTSGQIIGTSNIYSRVGVRWPFYSYKLTRLTHLSRGVGRHFSTWILNLVNDLEGASEVGGLFLSPHARSGGLGQLLARSRYLFIARHRQRFGSQVVAELRGCMDGDTSPFWEAVGKKFFASEYLVADFYNATKGNQFIADLMPRFPIYTALLPEAAQAVIGKPHRDAVPAMAMLEADGFAFDGYVDIFDAGPTLHAKTDAIRAVADARDDGGALELPIGKRGQLLRAQGNRLDFSVDLIGA